MLENTGSPFAGVIGLGAFQSEHKPSRAGQILSIVVGIGLLLGGPLVALLGVWIGWDTYSSYVLNKMWDSGFLLPLICGVLLIPLGGWIIFNAFRNWILNVSLFESGFVYTDRRGTRQIKWTDIDAVWQSITNHYRYGVKVSTTYLYTVQLNDKTRLVLDNKFSKIEPLGKAVAVGAANTLFPRYMSALKSGQRVTFGPLALDGNGMYSGNKSVAWQEIKAVKISQGIISIKKEGGWFNWVTVTVPQVPNFWIFIDLVSRFTKVE